MKKERIISYILVYTFIFSLYACSENDEFEMGPSPEILEWQANTNVKVSAADGITSYVWETNLLTLETYPISDILELNFELKTIEKFNNISQIELWVNAEEKEGYNYAEPYNYTRKLFFSITEIPENGKFSIQVPAESLYQLFKSEFVNDRSNAHLLDGDIYTFSWIVTHVDGSKYDSGNNTSPGSSFSVQVKYQDYLPPVMEGTYTYEYLEVGPGMVNLGIAVGTTGTIDISLTEAPGTYFVSDVNFSSWFLPNTLTHDFFTGLITVEEGFYNTTWAILSVEGASIDIYWQNNFTGPFGWWGVVRITRESGAGFPDNLYTAGTRPE